MDRLNVKECILKCDLEKMLTDYLRCYGKSSNPQPTDMERKAFRKLLEEVSGIPPVDINAALAAAEKENSLLDVTMIDSQQKEYGLLFMDWCEVLGLHIPQELTERFDNNRLMAAVLYEMTWFGMTKEEVDKERKATFGRIR